MITNAEITKEARAVLSGKWTKACSAIVSFAFILGAAELIFKLLGDLAESSIVASLFIWLLSTLVAVFVTAMIPVGVDYFFGRLINRQKVQIGDLLHPFGGHKYWRNVMVTVFSTIGSDIGGLIIVLPLLIGMFSLIFKSLDIWSTKAEDALQMFISNPSLVFAILGSLFVSLILFAILTTYFNPILNYLSVLVANNQKIGGFKAIKHTFCIVKNHRAKYWGLYFRLFGWNLLAGIPVAIALVAYIWNTSSHIEIIIIGAIFSVIATVPVIAYQETSFVILYRELETEYAKNHPESDVLENLFIDEDNGTEDDSDDE